MSNSIKQISRVFAVALLLSIACAERAVSAECVAAGAWAKPTASGPQALAGAELLAQLARQSVVLLGESHDSAEDHRWQLQMLAELHAVRPRMVLAFEMFPRRLQPELDRWVAGGYTETEFLKAVDWARVWNFEPQLYLPIFHFARMNRLPMVAMNVGRELVNAVGTKGFDAVPADQREGVTAPAPASDAYIDYLARAYGEHERETAGKDKPPFDRNNAGFRHFVEAQQVWDRAMAQAVAGAASQPGAPLVVGILGKGHIVQGYGVPHQLGALGVSKVSSLLPWPHDGDCAALAAGYADAVFGVTAAANTAAVQRPRLGVRLETSGGELRIVAVDKGSIGEAAGIHDGDVLTEAAGVPLKEFSALRAIVQSQAAGTWLPLKVRRQNDTLELVAKFPPAQP